MESILWWCEDSFYYLCNFEHVWKYICICNYTFICTHRCIYRNIIFIFNFKFSFYGGKLNYPQMYNETRLHERKLAIFWLIEARVCIRVFDSTCINLFGFLRHTWLPGPTITLSQSRDIQENRMSYKKELLILGILVFIQKILITHEIYLVFIAVLVRHRIFFFLLPFVIECIWKS